MSGFWQHARRLRGVAALQCVEARVEQDLDREQSGEAFVVDDQDDRGDDRGGAEHSSRLGR